MQHQSMLVSARVKQGLITQRPARLPVRASRAGYNAFASRLRAGSSCRAEHCSGVQLPVNEAGSAEPLEGPSSWARARLVLLTCVMAASVFLDKRAAHAAAYSPPSVVTEDKRSTQPRRSVWSAVKSASTAPLHVLDRLLFPDADEPIRLIRASHDFTEDTQAAPAAQKATPEVIKSVIVATAEIAPRDQASSTTMTTTSATATRPSASSLIDQADPGHPLRTHLDAAALAQQVSSAAVSSYHRLTAGVAAASSRLAPGWPAESSALSGLSQLPGVLSARLEEGETAALARLLLRGGYALGALVVAVMAWQLAAAVTDADGSSRSKTAVKAAYPAGPQEHQAVLLTDSGVSAAVLMPEGGAPAELQRTQIVGPYCIRPESSPLAAAAAATHTAPAAMDRGQHVDVAFSKQVVGPYCIRPAKPAATAAQSSSAADDLSAAFQGSSVVGPFCLLKTDQAAAAAAEVVHEALIAEAAAMRAAASASPANTELLNVLSQETAAEQAQQLTGAAVAAALTAAAEERSAAATTCSEPVFPAVEPLLRVQHDVGCSSQEQVPALHSREGHLAAEAVREALIAESAAATAAIAAERASTAAHKIEEAVMEEAAQVVLTAAASNSAACSASSAVGGDPETPVPVPAGCEDDVWQLVKEAKEAEAAAALAAIREAGDIHPAHSTSVEQLEEVKASTVLAAAEQDELHALIAEAIAAEAAAAAAAGLAADVSQAELIAEAVAAEAAVAAALAAADAAGAAAAADASAGQAAELAKCHMCSGPHADEAPHTNSSGNSQVQLSNSVSVSWVLPPGADAAAMDQLTALAAASGHPAIITSTTTATGIARSPPPAKTTTALSSADADSFKDEFAGSDDSVPLAVPQPAAGAAAAVKSSYSLADALSVASQAQMQAASVTAVQQAQDRMMRLYRARRRAATADGEASQAHQVAGPTAATAGNDLCVADLDPTTAQGDAADGPQNNNEVAKHNSSSTTTVVETAAATETVTPPATTTTVTAAAIRPVEVEITFTDTTSIGSGSFDVPVIKTPGNAHTALAHGSTGSSGSSSSGNNKKTGVANRDRGGTKIVPRSQAVKPAGSSSFEVPVVIEGITAEVKPSARAPVDSGSTGSSRKFKGFGKGLGRGAVIRYYVPLDGSSTTQLFTTATAAPAATAQHVVPVTTADSSSDTEPEAMAAVDPPNSTPGKPGIKEDQQQQGEVEGDGSIPVEWISTPNRVKRDQLHQRAAAILNADEETEVAPAAAAAVQEPTSDQSNKQGSSQFSGVASSAAALLADEVEPGVADLLKAAADRLDQGMATAYGLTDSAGSSSSTSTKTAAHLPPGWGSDDEVMNPADNSSWGDVTSQLAAELEDELAGLLTSAAARLDQDIMTTAHAMPEVPLPAAADIRAAEQSATNPDDDDSEAFGRYVPDTRVGRGAAQHTPGSAAGN